MPGSERTRIPDSDSDLCLVNLNAAHRTGGPPILVEDGPQGLVEVLAVAQERLAQDALLDGADLPQRAVAAAVGDRRTRLEPVRLHGVEREVDHELRAVRE